MLRVRHILIASAAALVAFSTDAAWACPMCKAAAEADPKLPTAFMASILFMMAMPFTLMTCFGVAFYRLSKQGELQSSVDDRQSLADSPTSDSDEFPA